jgi:hypothetical protein
MDRFKSCAKTLAEAQKVLSVDEYAELIVDLRKQDETKPPEKVFATFQHRIYFVVDDNVPNEVRAFENCLPTKDGSTDFIRKGKVMFGGKVFNF